MIPAKQQSRLLEEQFDQVPYLYPCAAMESHGTTRAGNLNQTLIQNSRCSYIKVLRSQEFYVIDGGREHTPVDKTGTQSFYTFSHSDTNYFVDDNKFITKLKLKIKI